MATKQVFTAIPLMNALIQKKIPLTESMIEGMINRAEFRCEDPIKIYVPSQLSSTTIYLKMRSIYSERTNFYPLSGFPRSLIAEDMINGTFPTLCTVLGPLSQRAETRLDKRAELIKERRYGKLAVASDPKVAISGQDDRVPKSPTNEKDGEESTLRSAESVEHRRSTTSTNTSVGSSSQSRTSSHTLVSQMSGGRPSSSFKTARQIHSIADLRAHARATIQDGQRRQYAMEDEDELARGFSKTLSLGSVDLGIGPKEPDFGSDDSDGQPPGDEEKTE